MGLALAASKVFATLRPQPERPFSSGQRLLVVDDEHAASSMISLRLRQSGFHVETAASGTEALRILKDKPFDLVLLDRLMPGYTGDRVLKELRLSHSQTDLPVIMVSAIDDSDQVAEALELGANDYITKPIDFKVALARIRSQLSRKQTENVARIGECDGSWEWNLETDRIEYSSGWATMLGLTLEEISSEPRAWFSRVHSQDVGALRESIQAHLEGKTKTFEMEYRIRCRSGAFRWMVSQGAAVRDAVGRPIRLTGSQRDINGQKTLDQLTGLPNRSLLTERLGVALENKRLDASSSVAVLVIGLDRFKLVNDSLGQLAGDRLLIEFASRIRSVVMKWRSASETRENSMVARLGGDEFAAILDGVGSPLQAVSIADQMLQSLRPIFTLNPGAEHESREFSCTASVGVAISGQRYQGAEDLLQDADAAMYSAKDQGRDCWALFSDSMRDRLTHPRHLENELRSALDKNQFRVYYQPRVDLNSEKIRGFEALVRWVHPRRGLVGPLDFIQAAEQSGVIQKLGLWVMEEACSQIALWQKAFPMDPPLDVAVNVSPIQLRDDDFVWRVSDILKRTGLSASALHLELTESVLIADLDDARGKLSQLKNLGVGLKLDDFATGYSCLKYLSKLPFDSLKIDRSFIGDLDQHDGVTKELVRAILGMAGSLRMGVIAEGIEREEHLGCLRDLGCQFGQGFYFSEPVDTISIERLLAADATKNAKESESSNQKSLTTSELSPSP